MTSAQRDLELLDALCRLSVAARRCGRTVRVQTDDDRLELLVVLTGLADVLRGAGSGQPQRQSEPGKDGLAEEGVDVDDPPA